MNVIYALDLISAETLTNLEEIYNHQARSFELEFEINGKISENLEENLIRHLKRINEKLVKSKDQEIWVSVLSRGVREGVLIME